MPPRSWARTAWSACSRGQPRSHTDTATPPETAKGLNTYIVTSRLPLVIHGAVMDRQVLTSEQVVNLAMLPPRDERLLGQMQAPISGLVTVLSAPLRGLVTVLQRASEQGGAAPAAATAEPEAEAADAPAAEADATAEDTVAEEAVAEAADAPADEPVAEAGDTTPEEPAAEADEASESEESE